MKLLISTQSVDLGEPTLGFFHGWIREFAKEYESVVVICLSEGEHDLPSNVRVLSLGKERGNAGKITYAWRFLQYAWRERKEYDAVFVHMNEEYLLLAGWLWKLLGKSAYMWRNHYDGSLLTDVAAFFCKKIFCTSKYSYTAKYKKTVLMPVGVDTAQFAPSLAIERASRSILFLARMAPSKRPHLLIDALAILKMKAQFSAHLYGGPTVEHETYYDSLKIAVKEKGLDHVITFHSAVPNYETPKIYGSHEIFVNLSPSGMFDKTIFEAMACGALTLICNEDLKSKLDPRLFLEKADANTIAERLHVLLDLSLDERKSMLEAGDRIVALNSLKLLSDTLAREMHS